MSNAEKIPVLLRAIEDIRADGSPMGWPPDELARVAQRRWQSYERRHPKARQVTAAQRILDLARGLQAHFEPDIPYTHSSDWQAVAQTLAEVLRDADS